MDRHGPFISPALKAWKPEHMKGKIERRCHWCAMVKKPIDELIIVLEAPMRFYFCTDTCFCAWQQQRYEPEVSGWLRVDAKARYKILKEMQDVGGDR